MRHLEDEISTVLGVVPCAGASSSRRAVRSTPCGTRASRAGMIELTTPASFELEYGEVDESEAHHRTEEYPRE